MINISPLVQKPQFGSVVVNRGHPLARGLVGCWMMNDGRGLVRDIASVSLNGTPTGTTPVSGPRWMGLSFGANASDAVTVTNNSIIQDRNQISLVVWARRTGAGGGNNARLVDKGTGAATADFLVRLTDLDGLVHFGGLRWSVTVGEWTIPEPTLNVLHQWVFTYDTTSTSNTPTMYLDAVSKPLTVVTNPAGVLVTGATSNLFFGNRSDGLRNWNGTISYVTMYQRLLTSNEVLWLFAEPFAFLQPIPSVRYWSSTSVRSRQRLPVLGVG